MGVEKFFVQNFRLRAPGLGMHFVEGRADLITMVAASQGPPSVRGALLQVDANLLSPVGGDSHMNPEDRIGK